MLGVIHKSQKRILLIFVFMLFLVQLGLQSGVQASDSAAIKNVRISYGALQTRIVCDFDAVPDFKDSYDTISSTIDVYFPKAVNNVKSLPKIQAASKLVQNINLVSDSGGGVHLEVLNKRLVEYKISVLNNPTRVVIDIAAGEATVNDSTAANGSTKDDAGQVKNDGGSTVSQQLGKGLTYHKMIKYTGAGPVKAFILRVAANSAYKVVPALSNSKISGLSAVSSMVKESNAVAGVNGSYFNTDGQILGLLMIDGEFVSTSDILRTSIGFWSNGKAVIDQIDYSGNVTLPSGKKVPIDAVNRERGDNMLVLYNHYYDDSTGTNTFGTDYVVRNGFVSDIKSADAAIPQDGVVLSVHGAAATAFADVKVGDKVIVEQKLESSFAKAENVIGAGPFLVRGGKPFITSKVEEFPSDIAVGRAPRTAVGIAADGSILLVVLDGRQRDSVGMTLQDLADFMIELGAVNALNMDGGGSSEMYINGQVVNSPSDGRERRVGDAIVVVPKK